MKKFLVKYQNRKGLFIAFGVLIFLCFLGWISFPAKKTTANNNNAPAPPIKNNGLYAPIHSFQKKYSRWPENEEELQAFIEKTKMDTSLKSYNQILFQLQQDGSLKVDFWLNSNGSVSHGTFIYVKP